MFKEGEHIYFVFHDGKTVLDSQNRPRMYKSIKQFEKCYPGRNFESAKLIEYAPIAELDKHAKSIKQ